MIITPTVGRVVWFHPYKGDKIDFSTQPLAALVTYVHSDTMVNLVVFDSNGNSHSRTSVYLMQSNGLAPCEGDMYCEWMPYQKGQAAKTEALEAKASEKPEAKASEKPALETLREVVKRFAGTDSFKLEICHFPLS